MGHDETTTNSTVNLAQFESVSGPPRMAPPTSLEITDEFTRIQTGDLPYNVVYFLPSGEVIVRNEIANGPISDSTQLMHQSFMVIRIKLDHNETGVPSFQVLKFRGDPKVTMIALTEAYLKGSNSRA